MVLLRSFSAALIIVFCLCLFGCGGEKPFDAEAAFTRLLSEVAYEAELEDESEIAPLMFVLPEGTEARFYSAGGASEDVLLMLTAPEGSDAAALDEAVDTYLAERLYDAERYSPEQVQKLKNAVRYSGGGRVILCVTDDYETARAIIDGR